MFGWMKEDAPRRMSEMSGAVDGGVVASRGLVAGTRVGTSMGWRAVEALAPGDMVLTFDNGLQRLIEVRRETYIMNEGTMGRTDVFFVPAGAMGNSVDVTLLPDQGVLIESEAACDAFGDPFAVLRAKALEGFRGIVRTSRPAIMEVITLVFANEEVVYAEGGILLHCPRAIVHLEDLGRTQPAYEVTADQNAEFLVECMSIEGMGNAGIPQPFAA